MTKIGFAAPPSHAVSTLSWIWSNLLIVMLPLAKVLRLFRVQHHAAKPGMLKKRSSLKAVSKQHYRVSSMFAVLRSQVVAKSWAKKIREATTTTDAIWEMSIEATRQRLIEELTWHRHTLPPLPDLAWLTPSERDVALGDRIYRLVALIEPAQAGKVTGMLLELENDELLQMLQLENDEDVASAASGICRWTAEAIGVLQEAAALPEPSTPQTPRTPSLPPPPPPSPAQGEWKVVTRRRRSKSREPPSFSHAELQRRLATPAAGAA